MSIISELNRQRSELFKEGKVRVSSNPYDTPIIRVRKSDDSIRVCIDYRAINERPIKNLFSLPRIDDLIDQSRDVTYITHLDLRSAYNQMRMSDDGRLMTQLTRQYSKDLLLMLLLVYWKCW